MHSGGESVNVMVGVRVRPLNAREKQDMAASCCIFAHGETRSVTVTNPLDDSKSKTFTFDRVYNSMDPADRDYATQHDVFHTMAGGALDHAFKGYNTCIFAYGQTGSGKTYTMMGFREDPNVPEAERTGLIPRVFADVFQRIEQMQSATKSFRVHVSYYEIYNERPSCLIDPDPSTFYRVREHPVTGPYVENISVVHIHNVDQIIDLLQRASAYRHTAATKMNDQSSRSHAVCTVTIAVSTFASDSGDVCETVSRMNLVDLAGSERSSVAGTTGIRLQEGSNINKSLLTLGNVIEALASASSGGSGRERFVPYRDSTLTWLLKDALGGNSRTHMLAMVSPSVLNYDESLNTLKYADRAKKITNIAVVNVDSKRRIIFDLRNEIATLRAQLQKYKDMQKMELSVDDDVLRLHREEPFLLQLQPVPTTQEPIMYFLPDGVTEITGDAKSEEDDSKRAIRLNKRFEVMSQHCAFERSHTNVTLKRTCATGVLTIDDSDVGSKEPQSLRTGCLIGVGDYVFKFVNPFDQVDDGSRRRTIVFSPKSMTERLQSTLHGVIDVTQVPGLEALAMKGEKGEKKLVRAEDGTLCLFQWETKEDRWIRVAADDVDTVVTDLISQERQEVQLSQRIAAILGDLAKTVKFPTMDEVMRRDVSKVGSDSIVTYDARKNLYAVLEVRDGLWKKAPITAAEISVIAFAEKRRTEQHQTQQQKSMAELSEKNTSLVQAKENLTSQMEEQEHQLSERHGHLQNLQLAVQHVRQRLQKKETAFQAQQVMFEKELESLERLQEAQLNEICTKISAIEERNHRLQEVVEAKEIEIEAKGKLLSMVEEARDRAAESTRQLKAQRERLVQQYYEVAASVTALKKQRDDLEGKCMEQTREVLELQRELNLTREIPEGSMRAEMLRLQKLYDELMLNHVVASDKLEVLSQQYTNNMTRDREHQVLLGELSDMISDLQAHHGNVQDLTKRARSECTHIEEEIKKSETVLTGLEAENKRMKEKLETTLEKARQQERELMDTKMQDRGREVKKLLELSSGAHSNDIKLLQKEKQTLRTTAQQLEEKVKSDKERITELERDIEKKEKRIGTLREEISQLQKDTQTYMAEKKKDFDKTISEKERDMRAATTKFGQVEQQLRDKKAGDDKLRQTIAEHKEQVTALQQEFEALSAQSKLNDKDVKEARQELVDAKRQLANTTSAYESALRAGGSGTTTPVGCTTPAPAALPRAQSFRVGQSPSSTSNVSLSGSSTGAYTRKL